ncbi:SGNH/GDSL hydrolase family protein [Streptomyces sp. YIM 98790]|uniref:golvesin C-terminal-like domain-containing protein n=1 Tax=Streptomyces sp. YIM 98790 TaxID=2689077 RepID=UPI0014098B2A|nr:SGNH/GDSL hydrolase family protein [Streptomyces sp. YIM 98790]
MLRLTAAAALLGTLVQPAPAAGAEETSRAPATAPAAHVAEAGPASGPATIGGDRRDQVLGADWRSSTDRAWTTTGDAQGFHLLVADQRDGYTWRTAASLSEPGFEADSWIGNACVTGSGERAVVVYAPRTFTNRPDLFARGAFAAVVELGTGDVTKLDVQTTLAYFNPGCGVDDAAVLTQDGGDDLAGSRLFRLDTGSGRLADPVETAVQVTSAVPLADGGLVGAAGAEVVRVSGDGGLTPLARTHGVPFELTAERDGGLVFLDRSTRPGHPTAKDGTVTAADDGDKRAVAHHLNARQLRGDGAPQTAAELARGPWTAMGVTRTAAGEVFVTGESERTAAGLPDAVRHLPEADREARVTTHGEAVLTRTVWADGKDTRTAVPGQARDARIEMRVLATGKTTDFTVDPLARPVGSPAGGRERSPALPGPAPEAPERSERRSGHSTQLGVTRASAPDWLEGEDERTCSVPRNHPGKQAMQPTPRQVEWAVNQAVSGTLNRHAFRHAGWKNLGMGSYAPQTLFPRHGLDGGGDIPSQVMLGVAAQESNLWQAARFALPGVTANPLIGNFYGIDYYDGEEQNDWDIDWAAADCGYGITQVTDGMRLPGHGQPTLTPLQQEAVALDYAANIAAGVRILEEKWNQTRAAGLTINNGDSRWPENWFFALWAYNSGFHPESEAGDHDGAWGVGWTNNPASPLYRANRNPFLDGGRGNPKYSDAAQPQFWPYPEKVLGWAAWPIEAFTAPNESGPGYRAAWWTTVEHREQVKPPEDLFCTAANWCDASRIGDGEGENSTCRRDDFKCWWHQPVSWKECQYGECGYTVLRFDSTYPEQPDGTSYPPHCTRSASDTGNAAPPGALIVDNVPASYAPPRPGCSNTWTNSGTFDFEFATDQDGKSPAKVGMHQLGAGFGGHFYFGHSRRSDRLEATGTWTLNSARDQWMRIAVHLPELGARTQQAKYEIDTGSGAFTEVRYINQKRKANNWVSLGVYRIDGVPRVRLSTTTQDGNGTENVAFDAVAFQPLPGKPEHIVAVLGDSYASGEGAGDYYRETDTDHGHEKWWNACRRSEHAWGRQVQLPGTDAALGDLVDSWSGQAELGFVACSGAQNRDIVRNGGQPYGEGQFGEIPQTESGVLSENTTLVMLTAGGNDNSSFASALSECGQQANCATDEFYEKYEANIEEMIPDLRITLKEIARKAPNAQIMLMGYPTPLSLIRNVPATCSVLFTTYEAAAIGNLAQSVQESQQQLVDELSGDPAAPVRVAFVPAISHFHLHEDCAPEPWIHGVAIGPRGDGDFHRGDPAAAEPCFADWALLPEQGCLSREAFHPNRLGNTAYAALMRTRLYDVGYGP